MPLLVVFVLLPCDCS